MNGRGGEDFVATGYLLAVLLPVLGLAVGLVLMNRGEPRATNVILLSIVASAIWALIIAASTGAIET